MKKVFISLGVIAVIVGIIIVAVYGGSTGLIDSFTSPFTQHDITKASTEKTYQQAELDAITEIEVNSQNYAVYIRNTQSQGLNIKYVSPLRESVKIEYSVTGEKLTITQTDSEVQSYSWWDWIISANGTNDFIVVEIPTQLADSVTVLTKVQFGSANISETQLSALQIEMEAGIVTLDRLQAQTANIKLSTGMLKVSQCTATSITGSVNSGTIEVKNTQCQQDLTLNVQAGEVEVEQCEVGGTIHITTDAGTVELEGSADTIIIETSVGSIDFAVEADHIDIKVDTGAVEGKINGAKSEYTIDADTDAGSCNVNNQQGTTQKTLEVEVNAGSINIEFTA